MTAKVYRIMADNKNQSSFIEKYDSNKKESILAISRRWKWSSTFHYEPIEVTLWRSDTGKKTINLILAEA